MARYARQILGGCGWPDGPPLIYEARPTKATRNLVWRDSNRRCAYCNKPLTKETFTLDHVIPKSKGGSSDASNLVVSCIPCNESKANKSLEKFMKERENASAPNNP